MTLPLGTLPRGARGRIAALLGGDLDKDTLEYLGELGFVEDAHVEVLHLAPLGGPVAVEVDGLTVALRRREANAILVRKETP